MVFQKESACIYAVASAAQTLPKQAVKVDKVFVVTGGGTWAAPTKYTVVRGTPGSGEVQFAGNPQSPSATLTFPAALTAGDLLFVEYIPVGAIAAAA